MATGSKSSVIAAVAGNSLVMVAKFVAFSMTGSGALFSEAIHTLADVLNQILLLVGIVRSEKVADDFYQYGYGKERFVWALVSAVGIFFLGCGVTLYHGISGLVTPHVVHDYSWAIAVLLFALVVEGAVLILAFRQLKVASEGAPFLNFLREEADPAAVAVLLEDSAAVLGVLIALLAILLTELTGEAYWDSLGSIAIAMLLGAIAVWLVKRNRQLLVGKAVPAATEAEIRKVLMKRKSVDKIVEFKGRVIDTDTYDVLIEVDFDGEEFADMLEDKLRAEWASIEEWEHFRAFAVRYADDVLDLVGEQVDEIEDEIRSVVPRVKHIDVEPN